VREPAVNVNAIKFVSLIACASMWRARLAPEKVDPPSILGATRSRKLVEFRSVA
jgi:hypothetical protein